MVILIINSGSSSLKFNVYESDTDEVKLEGEMKNNQHTASLTYQLKRMDGLKQFELSINQAEYNNRLKLLINLLHELGLESNVKAIGHRVVHGGQKYYLTTKIDNEVINYLISISELAPLHNPPAIEIIQQTQQHWPNIPQFACFDTSFHKTLPAKARYYAIPKDLSDQYKIYRYGFHGLSHQSVSQKLGQIWMQNKSIHKLKNSKIISCHLGSGASVCAILNGESIETSMGFSPDEGLMMATRVGQISGSVINFIHDKTNLSIREINNILNKESGLLGVGGTSDTRQLIHNLDNTDARLAIEMYIDQLMKYIGAYTAVLGGLDAIIFTGGVGQGSDILRQKVCQQLGFLGVDIDSNVNTNRENVNQSLALHKQHSKVEIWVIPAAEDYQIFTLVKQALNF
ncbi:MAG: acetate kinase [Patescibacteria group bacterium]